jgi:hypothetical protein
MTNYEIKAFTIDNNTFYSSESPDIPLQSNFGNLGEKYLFLMYRLNYLNETVKELFELNMEYHTKKSNFQYLNNLHLKIYHRVIRFSLEIKQIVDEMICFYYVLDYHKINSIWPEVINIDSIGKYINVKNKVKFPFLDNYKNLLENINNIGNAAKHSFVNSEIIWLENKTKTPILLAYYQKQNDTKNKAKFYLLELPIFLEEFNNLLDEFRNTIRTNFSL